MYRIELKVYELGFHGTIENRKRLRSQINIETEDRKLMRNIEKYLLKGQKQSLTKNYYDDE